MSEIDKRIEQRNKDDLQWVMSTEQGRRFLWRLLSYCRIYQDVEGTEEDIMKQLGRRQAGLYLLGIMSDADDEKVFNMMREAKNIELEDAYDRHNEHKRNSNNSDDTESDDYGGDYTNEYRYDFPDNNQGRVEGLI